MSQSVNLYRAELFADRFELEARWVLRITGAAAAVMGLWIGAEAGLQAWARAELRQLEARSSSMVSELEVLGRKIAATRPDPALAAHVLELETELDAKRRLSAALAGRGLGNTKGFSPLLEGLALGRVEGVWLSSIRVREGGAHVALGGHAVSAERLPDLLGRLGEQPAYAGREFAWLRLELDEDAGAIRFDLDTHPGDDS